MCCTEARASSEWSALRAEYEWYTIGSDGKTDNFFWRKGASQHEFINTKRISLWRKHQQKLRCKGPDEPAYRPKDGLQKEHWHTICERELLALCHVATKRESRPILFKSRVVNFPFKLFVFLLLIIFFFFLFVGFFSNLHSPYVGVLQRWLDAFAKPNILFSFTQRSGGSHDTLR